MEEGGEAILELGGLLKPQCPRRNQSEDQPSPNTHTHAHRDAESHDRDHNTRIFLFIQFFYRLTLVNIIRPSEN